jgi:hypothetical protein
MLRSFCDRCGSIILGPVQAIELCRQNHGGENLEKLVRCTDCSDGVRAFLAVRPEPIELDPIPPDPPLRGVRR